MTVSTALIFPPSVRLFQQGPQQIINPCPDGKTYQECCSANYRINPLITSFVSVTIHGDLRRGL